MSAPLPPLPHLGLPMPLFVPVGSPALALPSLAQKQAKLLLFLFDTPAALSPSISPGESPSRRRRYTLDVFGEEPVHGRTVTLRMRGSSATARPRIYMIGASWAPQADTSVSRYTAWDSAGLLGDKWIKGAILDVDTRGLERTVEVQGDGTTQATFIAQSAGRRVLQFSWPQFRARFIRLRPTNSRHWRLYSLQWIFDEEPLQLTRWETQPQNNGVNAWHTLVDLDIAYQSQAEITLQISAFYRRGEPLVRLHSLPSTSGGKRVDHVLPFALQGLLYKYLFTSPSSFYIYREESAATIQVWGEQDTRVVKPFGNDDLASPSREMRAARAVALRAGGGS